MFKTSGLTGWFPSATNGDYAVPAKTETHDHKRFMFLLVLISIFWISSVATAQIQPTITYKYYPVKPETGQSIYKQMFQDSIITHKDRKVVAITDWGIQYNCDYISLNAGQCEIEAYEVVCKCDITLPQLMTDEKKLNDVFDEYIPYLRQHEMHHCQIATDYANHLDSQLKSIKSIGPMECQALKTMVKAARNKAITEAKKEHRRFDRQTLENRKKFHAGKHFLGELFPENRQGAQIY